MEENKYVYAIYKDNKILVGLYETIEGVYKRLSHNNSDEFKLYHIVNGDLYNKINNSDDLYEGCKVAQVQIKSELLELMDVKYEEKREDYMIKSIRLYK